MRPIELLLQEDVYRRVEVVAAERGTTLSALVEDYLALLATGFSERMKQQEREIRARITSFQVAGKLSRDEIYRRSR